MPKNALARLVRDRSGTTAIEYGLIIALIGASLAGVLVSLGDEVLAFWAVIQERVAAPLAPPP